MKVLKSVTTLNNQLVKKRKESNMELTAFTPTIKVDIVCVMKKDGYWLTVTCIELKQALLIFK